MAKKHKTTLVNFLRETHPHIKWYITATLMQSATTPANSNSTPSATLTGNTRGVFIAQGAWWDNTKDGMKSFDLWNEKGYGGVDVTVCIAWIIP
jgi:Tctex-1 family